MTFYEEFNGPWLHLVTLDVSSIADRVLSLAAHEKETAVRVVRGMKMSTEERIFDEFQQRSSSRTTSVRTGMLSTSASTTCLGCLRVDT